jgi:hypothetical protein
LKPRSSPLAVSLCAWGAQARAGTPPVCAAALYNMQWSSCCSARQTRTRVPPSPEALIAAAMRPWCGNFTEQDLSYEQLCALQRKDAAEAARNLGLTPNEALWSCPLNRRNASSMDSRSGEQQRLGSHEPLEESGSDDDAACQEWLAGQSLEQVPPRSCLLCGVLLLRVGGQPAGITANGELQEMMLLPCKHSSLCEPCCERATSDAGTQKPSCPLCGTQVESVAPAVNAVDLASRPAENLDAATAVQVLRIAPRELWADQSLKAARSETPASTAVPSDHAAATEGPMHQGETSTLTFKDILGDELQITGVHLGDTISSVKDKIEGQTGMEPDEQLLVLGEPPDQVTLETATLAHHGVDSCSKLWLLAQNPAAAVARRAQRAIELGVAPEPVQQRLIPIDQAPLLSVVADEVAHGAESEVDHALLGDEIIEYAPLLEKILSTKADGSWRDAKGRALRAFLGAPLVDRTGTIDFGLRLKSLYPIPARDPTFSTSFSEIMLQRAAQIMRDHTGQVDVLWSGGIDTTAAVAAFLQIPGAKDRIRIRYCARSVPEYPLFFAEHISNFQHVLIEGHVRDAFDGVRPVVTGDPADMLLGTFLMADAFKSHWLWTGDGRRIRNPLFMGLSKPWQSIIPEMLAQRGLLLNRSDDNSSPAVVAAAKAEWVEFLSQHAAQSPIPIVSTFDWFWWITYSCKYQHDLIRICYNRKPGENLAAIHQSAVNFFEAEAFHQWSLSDAGHAAKMPDKRVWSSYKLPLKKFILDFNGDREYYASKTKVRTCVCASSPRPPGLPRFSCYSYVNVACNRGECGISIPRISLERTVRRARYSSRRALM